MRCDIYDMYHQNSADEHSINLDLIVKSQIVRCSCQIESMGILMCYSECLVLFVDTLDGPPRFGVKTIPFFFAARTLSILLKGVRHPCR